MSLFQELPVNSPNAQKKKFPELTDFPSPTKQDILTQPIAMTPLNRVEGVGRYLNSDAYQKLGYSNDPTLEDKYYEATPWYKQVGNATTQFFGQGVAAIDAQFSKLEQIKETFGASSDDYLEDRFKASEQLREKYPVFKSSQEAYGLLGYIPFTEGSLSKWTNFAPNLGFTFGTMLGVFAENLVATAIIESTTGGAGTGIAASKWLKSGYEGVKDILSFNKLNRLNGVNKLGQAMYEGTKTFGAAGNILRGAEALAAGKSLNGVLHSIYGGYQLYSNAAGEALIENSNSVGELMKDFKNDFLEKNGREPNSQEYQNMQDAAEGLVLPSTLGNIGVLMTSNLLQEMNAFKAGKALSKITVSGAEKLGAEAGKRVIFDKVKGEFRNATSREITKSRVLGFGRGALGTLSEGLEESAQGVIAKSTQDYFKAKYYNKPISWTDSVANGFAYAASDQGMEEFYAGIVTGGIFSGGGYTYNQYQLNKQKNELAKTGQTFEGLIKQQTDDLNEIIPLIKFNVATSQASENLKTQLVIEERIKEALEKGDTYVADLYRKQGLAKAMFTAKTYGKDKVLLDNFKDLANLERSDLAKYLGVTEDQLGSAKDFTKNLEQLEEISRIVDTIDEKFKNPFKKYTLADPKYSKLEDPKQIQEEFIKDNIAHEAWQGSQELLAGQYFLAQDLKKSIFDITLDLQKTNVSLDLLSTLLAQTSIDKKENNRVFKIKKDLFNTQSELIKINQEIEELDSLMMDYLRQGDEEEAQHILEYKSEKVAKQQFLETRVEELSKTFETDGNRQTIFATSSLNYLRDMYNKMDSIYVTLQGLQYAKKTNTKEYVDKIKELQNIEAEIEIVRDPYLSVSDKLKKINALKPEDQKLVFDTTSILNNEGISSIPEILKAYDLLGFMKHDLDYSEAVIDLLNSPEKLSRHTDLMMSRIYEARKELFSNIINDNTDDGGLSAEEEIDVLEDTEDVIELEKEVTPETKPVSSIKVGDIVIYKEAPYTVAGFKINEGGSLVYELQDEEGNKISNVLRKEFLVSGQGEFQGTEEEEAKKAQDKERRIQELLDAEIPLTKKEIEEEISKVKKEIKIASDNKKASNKLKKATIDKSSGNITKDEFNDIEKEVDEENKLTDLNIKLDKLNQALEDLTNKEKDSEEELSDIESLVITEENYNNWSNVRDRSDYDAFVEQVKYTLGQFDKVQDKSKITPETVEEMLSSVKAFSNKEIRDQIIPLIVAKYGVKETPIEPSDNERPNDEDRELPLNEEDKEKGYKEPEIGDAENIEDVVMDGSGAETTINREETIQRIADAFLENGLELPILSDYDQKFYDKNKDEVDNAIYEKIPKVKPKKKKKNLSPLSQFINEFNNYLLIKDTVKDADDSIYRILDRIKYSIAPSWFTFKDKGVSINLKEAFDDAKKGDVIYSNVKGKNNNYNHFLINPQINTAYKNFEVFRHQHALHLNITESNAKNIVDILIEFANNNPVYILIESSYNLARPDNVRIYSKDKRLSAKVLNELSAKLNNINLQDNIVVGKIQNVDLPSAIEVRNFVNSLDEDIKEFVLRYLLGTKADKREFIENENLDYKNGLSIESFKTAKILSDGYNAFKKSGTVNSLKLIGPVLERQIKRSAFYGEINDLYYTLLTSSAFEKLRSTEEFEKIIDKLKQKRNQLSTFNFGVNTLNIGQKIYDSDGGEFTIIDHTLLTSESKLSVIIKVQDKNKAVKTITPFEFRTFYGTQPVIPNSNYSDAKEEQEKQKEEKYFNAFPRTILTTISNDDSVFYIGDRETGMTKKESYDKNLTTGKLAIQRLSSKLQEYPVFVKIETPDFEGLTSPFYISPDGPYNPNVPEDVQDFYREGNLKDFSNLNEEEITSLKAQGIKGFGKVVTLIDRQGNYLKFDEDGLESRKGIIPFFTLPKGEFKIEETSSRDKQISYGGRKLQPIQDIIAFYARQEVSITEEQIIEEKKKESELMDNLHARKDDVIMEINSISKGVTDNNDIITYADLNPLIKKGQVSIVLPKTKGTDQGKLLLKSKNGTSIVMNKKPMGTPMALGVLAYLGMSPDFIRNRYGLEVGPKIREEVKKLKEQIKLKKGNRKDYSDEESLGKVLQNYLDFLSKVMYQGPKGVTVIFNNLFKNESEGELFEGLMFPDYYMDSNNQIQESNPNIILINKSWQRLNPEANLLEIEDQLDIAVQFLSKISFDTNRNFAESEKGLNFVIMDNVIDIKEVDTMEYLMDKYDVKGIVVNKSLLDGKNKYIVLGSEVSETKEEPEEKSKGTVDINELDKMMLEDDDDDNFYESVSNSVITVDELDGSAKLTKAYKLNAINNLIRLVQDKEAEKLKKENPSLTEKELMDLVDKNTRDQIEDIGNQVDNATTNQELNKIIEDVTCLK